MIKVNLVPKEILEKAQQRQRNIQIGAGAVMVLLLVAAISLAHWRTKVKLEAKLAADQAELDRLAAIVAQVEEVERKSAEVRQRLSVVDDLMKGRKLYPIFMSEFAKTLPNGVYVKSMATTSGANNTLKLVIAADSRSSEDIQGWIRVMKETSRFSDPEMGSVAVTEEQGTRWYGFSLKTTYTPKL